MIKGRSRNFVYKMSKDTCRCPSTISTNNFFFWYSTQACLVHTTFTKFEDSLVFVLIKYLKLLAPTPSNVKYVRVYDRVQTIRVETTMGGVDNSHQLTRRPVPSKYKRFDICESKSVAILKVRS